MKITVIQQDIAWGNPAENVSRLESLLAGAEKSDLYVMPEMFTTGFATLPGSSAEHEPAVGLEWMKRKASELDAALAGSICLEIEDGKCVNRFYFVKPDGDVAVYDKRHLFGYGGEGNKFRAGRDRVVVEFRGVRFLLAVCYDLRFPVWLRNRNDYDAMIVVANWPVPRRYAWDTLVRARAIENQCYVIAANRVGTDPACVYNGGTALIDPYGAPVALARDEEAVAITGELSLSVLEDFRAKFPVLEDADVFSI